MRQSNVAKTAGITSPMLSAYERGKQRPSLATIDKILRALDCDVRHLSTALQQSEETSDDPPNSQEAIPIETEDSEIPVLTQQIFQLIDAETSEIGGISAAEREILGQTFSSLALLARHLRDRDEV